MIDSPSTRFVKKSLASCEWRAVVGYEGVFEVSRCGKVRRIKSAKGAQLREKKLTLDPNGYLVTSLWYKNKGKTISVHRLVAMTWVNGDHSLSVNHKDGNKLNNHADNLEWISLADNTRHQNETGLSNKICCYKPTKIQPSKYSIIWERLKKGESQKDIAKDYKCSQPLISWIAKKGKRDGIL
jgi:hypothetical protein